MKKHYLILRVLIIFALVIGICGVLLSCAPKAQAVATSNLDAIISKGKLTVGFDTFVPWAVKAKTGEYIGFEIDVAKRLAKDMGVKIELVPTKWSGIIPALLTGKFDVIIGGMGIRPERSLKVNFTIPYNASELRITANKKLVAADWNTVEHFNRPDVKLTVRLGSSPIEAIKRFMPKAQVIIFDGESEVFQEVVNGKAHAFVTSGVGPEYAMLQYPDILFDPLKGKTFATEPIGFAIRKGDLDFLNFLNSWIIVTDASGFFQERKQYWFYTQDWRKDIE